ncbi:MAG: hypothetical protein JWN71_4949 [Xanthobacteraceae bacterium]|jgi:hypothetical protein|nr:hypothetical protein [Xanthobacteraceae bacterium]
MLATQFVPAAGLNPPISSSVAPSGIPAPADPVEPMIPSGDVAPRPDAVWAAAAPQPSAITVAITSIRCIDISSALMADVSGLSTRRNGTKCRRA